jgi:hypothetical protein
VLTAEDRDRIQTKARAAIEGATLRVDNWWVKPAVTFAVLAGFILYATYAAFVGENYYADPYNSPMYSPCIAASCEHVTFGPLVGDWWRLSPALLILVFPLSFRLTCYYYRQAYYRSYWLSPPSCGVREPHGRYTGETRFPLILQNLHRYTLYIAIFYPIILLYEAFLSFSFPEGFGIGLGTVILFTNAILLGTYTISCHSCRHLVGGSLNNFSRSPVRHRAWKVVTRLNAKHMEWAWVSLVFVAFTDLYVRLVAMGVISDPRIIF